MDKIERFFQAQYQQQRAWLDRRRESIPVTPDTTDPAAFQIELIRVEMTGFGSGNYGLIDTFTQASIKMLTEIRDAFARINKDLIEQELQGGEKADG